MLKIASIVAVFAGASCALGQRPAVPSTPGEDSRTGVVSSGSEVLLPANEGLLARNQDLYVLGATPSGNKIFRVTGPLNAIAMSTLPGHCAYGRFIPRAAPTLACVCIDEDDSSLLKVDPDSLAVSSITPVPDATAWRGLGSDFVFTARNAPGVVGVLRWAFSTNPQGKYIHGFSMIMVDASNTVAVVDLPNRTRYVHLEQNGPQLLAMTSGADHKVHLVDVGQNTSSEITSESVRPAPAVQGSGVPLRGFAVDPFANEAVLFFRDGKASRVSISTGRATAVALPVPWPGKTYVSAVKQHVSSGGTGMPSVVRYGLGVSTDGSGSHRSGTSVLLLDENFAAIGSLTGFNSGIIDFAFTPDGAHILIVFMDGSVGRYSVSNQSQIALAPTLLPEIAGASSLLRPHILGIR